MRQILFFFSDLEPYKGEESFRKGSWGEEIRKTVFSMKIALLG